MGESSTPTARDSRLDVARGIAIIGVVIFHVYRGLYAAGMIAHSTTLNVDRVIGAWSLCVFAFVTGTFVPRGVRKSGVSNYVCDRVTRFFVVYVVWTLIQGGIQLLAGAKVNTPTSIGAVFSLWRPLGQLWYLPFLIILTAVFIPFQPWKRGRAPWLLLIAAGVGVAFWGYDGGYVGTQGAGLLIFFAGGLVIGSERARAALDRFSPAAGGVIGVAVLVLGSWIAIATNATGPTNFWDGRTVVTVIIGIAISVATTAAVFLLGHGLRSAGLLALIGRRSLEVYLAHITMASGTRIVLIHVGMTHIWVIVVLSTVAGVFGSLVVGTVLRRIRLGWVFDGPAWLTRTPSKVRPQMPPVAGQA